MKKLRWASLLGLASAVALAQSAKPSVVAPPLEVDPNPALQKVEKELQATWFRLLDEKSGAVVPSRKEVEAAMGEVKRLDFREADEALAKLAEKAGTLYAVFGSVQYTVKKQVVLTGRVVRRDDGKLMKSARVELARGEDTIAGVFPALTTRFFEELGLRSLPTTKEVQAVDPVVKKDPDPIKKDPDVPPPPPPPVVDLGMGQRTAGTVLLVGGAFVLVGGVALSAAGCGFGCAVTPNGPGKSVPVSKLDNVTTGRDLMTIGFVGVGVGAATAVVGAILLGTAGAPVRSVSVVPMAGGGVVQIGGQF